MLDRNDAIGGSGLKKGLRRLKAPPPRIPYSLCACALVRKGSVSTLKAKQAAGMERGGKF